MSDVCKESQVSLQLLEAHSKGAYCPQHFGKIWRQRQRRPHPGGNCLRARLQRPLCRYQDAPVYTQIASGGQRSLEPAGHHRGERGLGALPRRSCSKQVSRP